MTSILVLDAHVTLLHRSYPRGHYWGLRDVNHSQPGKPLDLIPDVMNIGAAAESAISASGLILDHCGKIFGHDPATHLQQTSARREENRRPHAPHRRLYLGAHTHRIPNT